MKILSPRDYYNRVSTSDTHRLSYYHSASSVPLIPVTIGQLVDIAAGMWGDKEALVSVYENIRLTFKQVRDKADELAAGISLLGLKSGDVLAVWALNSSIIYLVTLAAARLGLVLARIDPNNEATELLHCLQKVEAKALIVTETGTDKRYYDILCSVIPEISTSEPGTLSSKKLPHLKTVVFHSKLTYPGTYSYKSLLKMSTPAIIDNIRNSQNKIQPDSGISIHFTSGTTGQSKGVLISHLTLVNNSNHFVSALNNHEQEPRFLTQMQLCHIGANVIALLGGLHTGGCTVIPSSKFDPESSVKALLEERCTCIMGTPAMYVDLIDHIEKNNVQPQQINNVLVGAAPVTDQLISKIKKWIPTKEIMNGYGMTECGLMYLSRYRNSGSEFVGPVSEILPHFEVKIVDSHGHIVPISAPGELCVRSYSLMRGYWNDEQKTKETITKEGWLKTGDRAEMTNSNCITIVGRVKDAIIRGGDKIFPRDTEEFFQTHPEVLDAQAFGVPDQRWGEEMCIFIRTKGTVKLTEEDMKQYCKGKIAEFRIPRYVRFLDDFPRNTTGKVDKFKLQDMFKKEVC